MAQRAVFTVAVGLFLIVGLALWPVQVVSLKLPRENYRWIASIPAAEGDRILLTYRHSVELSAVEGYFQVGPQSEILALKTRMQSTGTGLPNTAYDRTEIRNGWIEVDEARRPVGTIRFFLVPINQTRLVIVGREVDLSAIEAGALLEISVENRRLIQRLFDFLRNRRGLPASKTKALHESK
ncbi:MAG: DUF1850 domain-containing protein [Planctomycetota bacterium]|jgi:hypothetical protein